MRSHPLSCALIRAVAAAAAIGAIAAIATIPPAAPTAFAQAIGFERAGAIPGPADAVRAAGTRAYVAAGKTLTVYDISAPDAPRRLGAYTFPEEIWSFRVAEPHVYVGANFFGLGILDVSNPAAPTLAGSFKTPGQAKTAAVYNGKALIIDHMEGVVMADLANPAKPAAAGSFFVEGYARDLVIAGSLAFAVDSPTGLYVFDLASATPLEPISALQTGTALRTIEVSADGRFAMLVGGGTLQPYDVSTPAKPVKLPPFKTPGGAQRAALDGRTVYVADAREGLQVIDFGNASAPAIVGGFKTAAPARDVAVAGATVLVLTGAPQEAQEVVVLRRSEK